MANLVPFQRKSDRAVVMINPDYVIAVDPYRQEGWSVIFTTGATKTGVNTQSYVVVGYPRAVAKKLNTNGEKAIKITRDEDAPVKVSAPAAVQ
jgi:hypothetical protein